MLKCVLRVRIKIYIYIINSLNKSTIKSLNIIVIIMSGI